MTLMKNAKKKKRPIIVLMTSSLAVFGAYSLVSKAKNCVMDKACFMINKLKNMKNKAKGVCVCDCDMSEDDTNQY